VIVGKKMHEQRKGLPIRFDAMLADPLYSGQVFIKILMQAGG
jgi:hypothetical protein